MGPNPNGPRLVCCDRAVRYSGLGVRSLGTIGDFLEPFTIRGDETTHLSPTSRPLNDATGEGAGIAK